MAAINAKTVKRLLDTVNKQLKRELSMNELSRLLKGDNTILSQKKEEEKQ